MVVEQTSPLRVVVDGFVPSTVAASELAFGFETRRITVLPEGYYGYYTSYEQQGY